MPYKSSTGTIGHKDCKVPSWRLARDPQSKFAAHQGRLTVQHEVKSLTGSVQKAERYPKDEKGNALESESLGLELEIHVRDTRAYTENLSWPPAMEPIPWLSSPSRVPFVEDETVEKVPYQVTSGNWGSTSYPIPTNPTCEGAILLAVTPNLQISYYWRITCTETNQELYCTEAVKPRIFGGDPWVTISNSLAVMSGVRTWVHCCGRGQMYNINHCNIDSVHRYGATSSFRTSLGNDEDFAIAFAAIRLGAPGGLIFGVHRAQLVGGVLTVIHRTLVAVTYTAHRIYMVMYLKLREGRPRPRPCQASELQDKACGTKGLPIITGHYLLGTLIVSNIHLSGLICVAHFFIRWLSCIHNHSPPHANASVSATSSFPLTGPMIYTTHKETIMMPTITITNLNSSLKSLLGILPLGVVVDACQCRIIDTQLRLQCAKDVVVMYRAREPRRLQVSPYRPWIWTAIPQLNGIGRIELTLVVNFPNKPHPFVPQVGEMSQVRSGETHLPGAFKALDDPNAMQRYSGPIDSASATPKDVGFLMITS
ncbi:hypothetical protein JB92DRAFT_2837532 [Gautieria morchelliformis]|nr:hypothetical protein JB92DRAFT_2837532 [Gautieria morchelliformis]